MFGSDASASNARKIFTTYPTSDPAVGKTKEIHEYQKVENQTTTIRNSPETWYDRVMMRVPEYEGEPKFFRPVVSRRLYNGKRALMFHNIAPNGSLKYYFKTLSSTRDENTSGAAPDDLASTVNISDFGTYTSPVLSDAENCVSEVYGTGAMSVKGYDHEIFVAASGMNRLEDNSGYRYGPISYGLDEYYRYIRLICSKSAQEVRLEFFSPSVLTSKAI